MTLGGALLAPTRLYVKSCLRAIRETGAIKGLAHITGGGFIDNIPRVLPRHLGVGIDLARLPVLPVFKWLAEQGGIAELELLRTFNCGIGMIAIVQPDAIEAVTEVLTEGGETVALLGEVIRPRVSIGWSTTVTSISRDETPRRHPDLRRGSNMTALIDAAKAADFPAEIVTVISNRADAGGLEKAAASGIPTVVIESKPFGKDRAAFEAVLQRALDESKIELICLGGFMRLFTAEFVQRWYGRMLNIHPSLLPCFPGLDPHGQALKAGVKISGATVHFVIRKPTPDRS